MRNGYRESFSSLLNTNCGSSEREARNESDEYLSVSTVDLVNREMLKGKTMDTEKSYINPHIKVARCVPI
jgi:hypothetical protein